MSQKNKIDTDEKFKALLVARDEKALADLYFCMISPLKGYFVKRIDGAAGYQLAEDLAQEVFVNFIRLYGGRCPPIPYLFLIANYLVLKHRKEKVHDDLADDLPDLRPTPEEECEEKEFQEIIKSAIDALRPTHREVVKRTIFGEMSSEIAEILGITVENVRARLARGKETVRGIFYDRVENDNVKKLKKCRWRGIDVIEEAGRLVVKRVSGVVARMKNSLRKNDIIVEMGDKPVHNIDEFAKRTKETEASKDVILIVIRVKARNEKVEITVPGAKKRKSRSF
jgi:RNA polymerase sigma factor (sigma-70 family)